MTALIEGRNTPKKVGGTHVGTVAAAVRIFPGAIIMRNADGDLTPATTATGLIGVGRAEQYIDNSEGLAGADTVIVEGGYFKYANSDTDPITKADIGTVCFAVDDQTVAATDGSATRSPAGIVDDVDDRGVWVHFNEALTRTANS